MGYISFRVGMSVHKPEVCSWWLNMSEQRPKQAHGQNFLWGEVIQGCPWKKQGQSVQCCRREDGITHGSTEDAQGTTAHPLSPPIQPPFEPFPWQSHNRGPLHIGFPDMGHTILSNLGDISYNIGSSWVAEATEALELGHGGAKTSAAQ